MKTGGATPPVHRAQALSLLSVAVLVYAADQLAKNWVVANLPEGRPVPVFGEVLQWYFVRNPGAAFSMASGATWLFTLLAVGVVAAIIWQVRHLGSRTWAVFFALLLGGVLGNLTDRLTREPGFPVGHVIDFISTPWLFPWPLSPAIYNVADIAIVSAMCLFVILTLLGLPIDGSPRKKRGEAAEDAVDAQEAAEPVPDTSDEVRALEAEDRAGSELPGRGTAE